ncbi:MAG: hypothetical protein KJP23_23985 [Deltaproteobacteria bacterium]|nr:hypothetical protein [Deltaproteobacteria bacterium]
MPTILTAGLSRWAREYWVGKRVTVYSQNNVESTLNLPAHFRKKPENLLSLDLGRLYSLDLE